MAKATLHIRWGVDGSGKAARTTNEVELKGESQFFMVKINGKPILITSDDYHFGIRNGGSMIPLRVRQRLTVETDVPYPGENRVTVVAMLHRSGRQVRIKDDNKGFALA